MPEKFTGTVEITDGSIVIKDSSGKGGAAIAENGARIGQGAGHVNIVCDQGLMMLHGPKGAASIVFVTGLPGFGLPAGAAAAAKLLLGTNDIPGILTVHDKDRKARFEVDASNSGTIKVLSDNGTEVLRFDSKTSVLDIGGGGSGGDVRLKNEQNKVTVHMDGNAGDVKILDDAGGIVIHLDRKARDIKLKGADCAEIFSAQHASNLDPGSLCVIGPNGTLEHCTKAYDTRVAGVVAGAGDLHPGIVLGQGTVAGQSVALSITGRVWCKVDAGFGPIAPGDLVTTSSTPGHGMRADDRSRLTGAVAGKALAGLPAGCDLIPILVGLQ
jgi:hypothetical protein